MLRPPSNFYHFFEWVGDTPIVRNRGIYALLAPNVQNSAKTDFRGPKIPSIGAVLDKRCSTMCGTHVQALSDHQNLIRLAGGVRIGQNLPQKWPKFGFGALRPQNESRTPEMDPKLVPATAPHWIALSCKDFWLQEKLFGWPKNPVVKTKKDAGIGNAENSCQTQWGTQYLNRCIGYSWGAACSQQTHWGFHKDKY